MYLWYLHMRYKRYIEGYDDHRDMLTCCLHTSRYANLYPVTPSCLHHEGLPSNRALACLVTRVCDSKWNKMNATAGTTHLFTTCTTTTNNSNKPTLASLFAAYFLLTKTRPWCYLWRYGQIESTGPAPGSLGLCRVKSLQCSRHIQSTTNAYRQTMTPACTQQETRDPIMQEEADPIAS